jgi:hypothetical protein
MIHAAIVQASKDKLIPKQVDMETYVHTWDSVKRMIEKALEKQGE